MRIIIFICLLSFYNFSGIAQTTIEKREERLSRINVDFGKVFPEGLKKNININSFIRTAITSFATQHIQFGYVSFYYSILPFQMISHRDFEGTEINIDTENDYTGKLKSEALKNKSYYENIYRALIPFYKSVFYNMTPEENEIYLQYIKDGLDYATNFNLDKEISDERELKQYFAQEKGKLCAFIYRRIKNKELSKVECVFWLNKIYNDLVNSSKKPEKKEQEFVLTEKISGPFYQGVKYGTNTSLSAIFAEYEGNFSIVAEGVITKGVLEDKDNKQYLLPYYLVNKLNEEKEIYIFNPHLDNDNCVYYKKINKEIDMIHYHANRIILRYTNGTKEILYGKIDKKDFILFSLKVENETLEEEPVFDEHYELINYKDGSSEAIYFYKDHRKNPVRTGLNSNISFWRSMFQQHYRLIGTVDNKYYFLTPDAGRLTKRELPPKYSYSHLFVWKKHILFSIAANGKRNNDPTYIGVLSMDGKIVLEPIYTFFQTTGNESEIILLCDQKGRYAVYDIDLKPLTAHEYKIDHIGSSYTYDPLTYDEIPHTNKTNSVILEKIKTGKQNTEDRKVILMNGNGHITIPEKWPYIEMSYCSENEEFYLVNNKVRQTKDGFEATGKYAIFNAQGKQMTKFMYDFINISCMPMTFNCTYRGKKICITKSTFEKDNILETED